VIPSNTARSGILFPIVNALALDTGSNPDQATRMITGSYLNMVSMASLTISSALWLTGMAGNFIGVEIAAKFGVDINFISWFLAASIPCLAAQIILPYALYLYFPPTLKDTTPAQHSAAQQISALGTVSRKEWITATVFIGMVTLWGLSYLIHLNLAVVALLGLAILLVTNVYRLENLRTDGGDVLETYIWFSILYVMSSTLNELGFMQILGTQISGLLVDFNWFSVYLILTVLYVLIHYLFVSQTAQLLALFAVFLEVGIQAQVPAGLMAFMLLFATNYFSAMAPQASSGNVIFVGSGYLEAKEVYKNGALVTLINLILFLLATPWISWMASHTR
jgi:DASS family divalent anion:Na+ symporter